MTAWFRNEYDTYFKEPLIHTDVIKDATQNDIQTQQDEDSLRLINNGAAP